MRGGALCSLLETSCAPLGPFAESGDSHSITVTIDGLVGAAGFRAHSHTQLQIVR